MGSTIKDVAAKAGVSTTTVSHVINDTRFVSSELRERVLKAIQDVSYFPNDIARGLRRGDTATIGLIVPDNSNPYFAEIAKTIEDIGFNQGYSVILCNSAGDLTRETAYINMLSSKQVDGVIFIAAHSEPQNLMLLKKRNIPVILVDRDVPLFYGDVVLVNNEQGGYIATKYLLEIGHTKIACITGPSDITPSADRIKGYLRALNEAGLEKRDDYLIMGNFGYQSGEDAVDKLILLDELPSAVFVCNDMMAIGVLRRAKFHKLRIPEDISIVGFDNIQFSAAVSPALTTIAQPIKELSSAAINRLISQIQSDVDNKEGIRIMLDTQLIIRDSCIPYEGRSDRRKL
jgi:LacI family transcriptional regulator